MSIKNAVRIVNVDYYMSAPIQDWDVMYSDFRGSSISQVPIIRIFGSTETGQKICLHIHGVFPYLYIPYDGIEDCNSLKYQIAANIDKALNVSFGQASALTQHVYKITPVSGIPFYGYHTREHQFFKIYLFNPNLIRKVSNMLQSEVILGRLYQPHESHIPYILQFMIDYNLHGMSRILLNDLKVRDNSHGSVPKQSYCQLEADTLCENILNRLEIMDGKMGINPGIAALWEDEKQRLRDKEEDSQIGPCLTLENSQVEPTKSHEIFKRAFFEKLCFLSDSNETVDQNLSVYPAETPRNINVQNASFVENHSLSGSSLNDSVGLNATFDDDARDLFEVLQDLGRRNNESEEADSILSQLPKEEEEEENELDLSVSMADTTPFKNILESVSDDDLNVTLIPQLDGSGDEKERKNNPNSKYGCLPIFVSTHNGRSSEINDELEHAKRRLYFQNNVTICEDSVECEYRPKIKEKECIVETQNLTVAEIYDLQTNYKPKEGCSTVLTQNSDTDLKLSSESDIFPSNSTPKTDANYFLITPSVRPPTRSEVFQNLESLGLPRVVYETPFYSDVSDVTSSVEIGHSVLKIPSKTTAHLEEFQGLCAGLETYRRKKMPPSIKFTNENVKKVKLSFCSADQILITPLNPAPSICDAEIWLKNRTVTKPEVRSEKIKITLPVSPDRLEESDMELTLSLSADELIESQPVKITKKDNSCQITGTSLNNTYGFKMTPENYQNAKALNEFQYITILSLELHIQTRGDLKPDPAYDSIRAIFYKIVEDGPGGNVCGIITLDRLKLSEVRCDLMNVSTEEELLNEFVKLVQKHDPDILVGYEIEMLSWGYLLDRGQALGHSLVTSLSRVKEKHSRNEDNLRITGRILLDVWRLLRHEIALQSYTFENIVYHVLHQRIPLYSFRNLAFWWHNPLFRHRTISHYTFRTNSVLQILEQLDLVGRTSELARLFGIQFFEVLSRGSQFRVESMMLRLAKPLNYIPVSPSVQQRAKMKAPEFLPLILEPESKLYVDPVIVLDFQSLYPSMIIAYNYCFSTCLGKVVHLGKNTPFEFGAYQLKVSKSRVEKLLNEDCINFSPCGVAFVKKQVRDGILPRMLREILDTRLMVKNSMKRNKDNKLLQKVLHNRQLGLKLIANVTYGYTSANFSGRMPAVELGDSVVSKGRETLQRAIELVENTKEWGARVVYGDTDSLFVLVPGKSREDAFEIGKKIADAVTNSNPDPVKLKLEKIYHPCILQTKKRYVGYMYESPDQTEPIYLAKGIETVRRDGCPAVSKMLEKCLRLLFETKDVSLVKKYVLRQLDKILTGRVSLQDLTFAKEYRGASGYRPGACVPALELARKWTSVDRRSEPRRGERVPYIIAHGPPGVPLIRLVRSPHDFLNDPSLRPNAIYYITKVIIPPINRCFNLIGADLNGWFNQMPRKQFQYLRNASPIKKSTISQYFVSNNCASCGEQTQNDLCEKCQNNTQTTTVVLHEKVRIWEQSFYNVNLICHSCTGIFDENVCISLDCPLLYRINQTSRDLEQAKYVRNVINTLKI
ncbi:DNA polymerase zeta catalytic subunit [Tribolium madens]|uniref:DNA polymerase zeta catalytic subunit n=1 Tax=Tribolium madens TaxID=41895 RepID=UPI001CF756DB|nr:DNA polymerase zeta catalytic subunit [Tribolium madens]